MNLDWIRSQTVDSLCKGLPALAAPIRQDEVGQQGWNLLAQDLPFPVAIIRRDVMEANRAWMRAFLRETGVALCPHGKTTMSPELFALQMEDGAFGMTCATASHLEVYRRARIPRVILANQLVGRTNLHMALRHLLDPAFELYCLVDSAAGLDSLAQTAKALGLSRPVKVLIEMGAEDARTGLRTLAEAIELTRQALSHPELMVAGVEAYEGVFAGDAPAQREAPILDLLDRTAQAAEAILSMLPPHQEPFLLTAGGSDFFDLVTQRFSKISSARPPLRPVRVVLRGGCYLTHDSLHYARCFERLRERSPQFAVLPGGLRGALEVWSVVQSRPEPTRAYCALGKRDISNDWEPPKPLWRFRPGHDEEPRPAPPDWRTLRLNDQHLHLETPADSDISIGDLVGFGVSHPCTTFDKWSYVYIVNEKSDIIDLISTFF